MLTNKQIHTLLLENKDIKAFQKYVGFKSRQALECRLRSDELKNNLLGQYLEFLVYKKKWNGFGRILEICFDTLGLSHNLLRK